MWYGPFCPLLALVKLFFQTSYYLLSPDHVHTAAMDHSPTVKVETLCKVPMPRRLQENLHGVMVGLDTLKLFSHLVDSVILWAAGCVQRVKVYECCMVAGCLPVRSSPCHGSSECKRKCDQSKGSIWSGRRRREMWSCIYTSCWSCHWKPFYFYFF